VVLGEADEIPPGLFLDRLITRSMDYIWTPWRYAYITTAAKHDGKP